MNQTGAMLNLVESALLALKGAVIPDDIGIVGRGVEETIKNMGRISSPGMIETDRVILDIVGGG